MTEAEHTPGPWGVTAGVATRSWGVCAPSGQVGVTIFLLADARFIAAAPDMEKALEYVLSKSTIDMDDAMIDVVTAALAKAKGEANA